MASDPVLESFPGDLARRKTLTAIAAGATDIGQREHNEDHVLLRPELGLFVLTDGAGGHNAGNVASAIAATTAANVYETTAKSMGGLPEVDALGLSVTARRLASAVQRANAEVIDIAKKAERYQGMGTTLVAAAFTPGGDVIHIAHVGDSRCYRLRAGVLELLTADHSLVNDVLETHPDIDDQLLERMPRHVVTRALGMEERVRVPVRSLRVLPDDVYLLCSDGLTDVLDESVLEVMLAEPLSPDEQVKALLRAAVDAEAQDNVAAIVVECHESAAPPRRRPASQPAPPVVAPAMPPARRPVGSAPEIIIVGVETRVVPMDSASASLLDALGTFARLRQPSVPEVSRPKPSRCAECGQPLEAGVASCPMCGAAVA